MAKDDWMFDNTGGELTPKAEEKGVGSKIVGALGRTAEALPDALAKKNPIIGLPLQALFNTDEYQARQAGYQMAKERLAELRAKAELRKQELDNALMKAQAEGEDFPETRAADKARRAANVAKSNLDKARSEAALPLVPQQAQNAQAELENQALVLQTKRDAIIQQDYKNRLGEAKKWVQSTIKGNPVFRALAFADQKNLPRQMLDSMAEWKVMIDAATNGVPQRDKRTIDMLNLFARERNITLRTKEGKPWSGEKDGTPHIFTGDTLVMEATPQALQKKFAESQFELYQELTARKETSPTGYEGNPAARGVALTARRIAPLLGDSVSLAMKAVEPLFQDCAKNRPEDFAYYTAAQALDAFDKGEVKSLEGLGLLTARQKDPQTGKELPSLLEKMGIKVVGEIDPKKPDPRALEFDLPNGERVGFSGLGQYIKENDVFGRQIEKHVGTMQMANAIQQAREFAARSGKPFVPPGTIPPGGTPGKTGKTGKAAGAGTPEEQEPKNAQERYVQEQISGGNDFIRKYNLGDYAERIGRSSKKSDDEIRRIFYLAGREAEDAYAETGNWGEAQKKFEKVFKDAGIPASLVPDLWTDKDLKDQEAKNREAMRVLRSKQLKMKNDPEYNRMRRVGGELYVTTSPAMRDKEKFDEMADRDTDIKLQLSTRKRAREDRNQAAENRRKEFRKR